MGTLASTQYVAALSRWQSGKTLSVLGAELSDRELRCGTCLAAFNSTEPIALNSVVLWLFMPVLAHQVHEGPC